MSYIWAGLSLAAGLVFGLVVGFYISFRVLDDLMRRSGFDMARFDAPPPRRSCEYESEL